MFISDKLIYLHLQKTGGSHVTRILSRYIPCEAGKQLKHGSLPEGYVANSKYVVGSMRNPWDWYVSLWAYGCSRQGAFTNKLIRKKYGRYINRLGVDPAGALRGIMSERSKPVTHWQALYRDSKDPGLFREWLGLLLSPERKYDIGPGYAASMLSTFAGIMTFRYIGIYTVSQSDAAADRITSLKDLVAYDRENNILDDVIRTESLHHDLLRVIAAAGYRLDKGQIEDIRDAGRTNTSSRYSAGYYYDNRTLDLVMEKEQLLVEKYAYQPPDVS